MVKLHSVDYGQKSRKERWFWYSGFPQQQISVQLYSRTEVRQQWWDVPDRHLAAAGHVRTRQRELCFFAKKT